MKNWFVLYTKPKCERKVAERLSLAGFDVYCPLVKTVKQWSDRKKKVTTPLFSSYVFIFIDEQSREEVFNIPGVVRFLFWLGKPAIVRSDEIQEIKDFLTNYSASHIISMRSFEIGQKVRIKEGPLKQLSGEVLMVNRGKVQLQISSIGLTLQATLPMAQLV